MRHKASTEAGGFGLNDSSNGGSEWHEGSHGVVEFARKRRPEKKVQKVLGEWPVITSRTGTENYVAKKEIVLCSARFGITDFFFFAWQSFCFGGGA